MTDTSTAPAQTGAPTSIHFGLLPRYRSLLKLAIGSLVVAGLAPPALVLLQAMQGAIDRIGIVLLVAGFPFLVLCLWLAHMSFLLLNPNRLELDAQLIRWRTSFFVLEAPWNEVTGFGKVSTGQGEVAGLRTRAPLKLSNAKAYSLIPHELHGIPTLFFGDLEQGELRQAIERFAPEVVGMGGQGQARD